MPKPVGRPNGHLIHAEAFEAILIARGLMKKDVTHDADISPSFLADLLAHRCGATGPVAERLAAALGVRTAAIFPGFAGWIGPIPNRAAKRTRTEVAS